ncbi:MAG: DUF2281 domain-containing protein [Sphingobacteriales bacterium]
MSTTELIELINKLPSDKQKEVEDFIGSLMTQEDDATGKDFKNGIKSGFGGGKGIFGKMAEDFDAPLDEMKEYM